MCRLYLPILSKTLSFSVVFVFVLASTASHMAVSVARLSEPKPTFLAFVRLKCDMATNVILHVRHLFCGFIAFETYQSLFGATCLRIVLRCLIKVSIKSELHDFFHFNHADEPSALRSGGVVMCL